MLDATQLKEYAQLTQATYAYFSAFDYKNSDGLKGKIVQESGDPSLGANFTVEEANLFADRYELLHQSDNADPDGFSASLFRDKSTGRLVLSFRGTEPFGAQIVKDLFMADLRIGTDGYASPQAIAMYRYIKQLTTPAGQAVQYSAAEIAGLKAIYLDRADTATELATRGLAWSSVESGLAADKGIDAGQGAGALIPAGAALDFTGHSLGGHLAILASRLFPGLASQVVTLNAPGFFPQSEAVLDLFSPDWATTSILRMEAAGDAVSEIGSVYPGTRVLIGQENEPGASASLGTNHDKVNSADGLALTELMGKLDTRIAADARLAKAFLDAAAVAPKQSYETLLDGLRRLFLGQSIASTPFNDEFKPVSRDAFYKNISELANNDAFKSLSGKVTITLPDTNLSSARTDFASLLTLLTLSPVMLKAVAGNEGAVEAALGAAWATEYADWQADKELTSAQLAQGQGNYTDQYLTDRAAFLAGVIEANTNDTGSGKNLRVDTHSTEPIYFKDEASGLSLQQQNGVTGSSDGPQYLFGGEDNDTLWGKDTNDHLYGGLGMDRLDGSAGDDYLEGNAGSDNFTGGQGDDTLIGGKGLDTYRFANDEGWDLIEDQDGQGTLYYDDIQLTGGEAADDSGRVWKQVVGEGTAEEKTFWYILTDETENGQTTQRLTIQWTAPDEAPVLKGGVRIKHWQAGELGITLPGAAPFETPDYPADATAKRVPANDSNIWYKGEYYAVATYDDLTQHTLSAVGAYGTVYGNGVLNGNEYANHLSGVLFYSDNGAGPTDADYLAEIGADFLVANDVIFGGSGRDVLRGNTGEDRLDGGEDGDLADGGSGDDTVIGGAGDDWLMGGRGKDTLIGKAGNDHFDGASGNGTLYGAVGDRAALASEPEGSDSRLSRPLSAMLRSTEKNGQKRNISGAFDIEFRHPINDEFVRLEA